jgi:hypothetical protein
MSDGDNLVRQEFFNSLWRGNHIPMKKPPSLEVLKATEWSPSFEQLMRNRLIMGSFRYGRVHDANICDNVEAMRKRISRYVQTGKIELLADIANFALMEFVRRDKEIGDDILDEGDLHEKHLVEGFL